MSVDKKRIIIKRYASRRLYNSDISEYVTLNEIADLIRGGHDVQILDKKTGEDLTRQYLLQIISDQEANGEKAFPVNILMEVIRAYKDQTQTLMPDFLSKSYEMFKEQQALYLAEQKELFDKASALNPAAKAVEAPDLIQAWQNRMTQWLEPLSGASEAAKDYAQTFKNPVAGFDMASWQEQQKAFFSAAMKHMNPSESETKPDATASSADTAKDDEIAQMKAQLAALHKKLDSL